MADDKKLKLKEVTQGGCVQSPSLMTSLIPKINTGLTHYVCLNNQHKVKQLLLYTLEIKTGHYLAYKNMLKVSNKISTKRCCVNVVQS